MYEDFELNVIEKNFKNFCLEIYNQFLSEI